MPEVKNCRRCGRIFNYIGGNPICPICKELDEKDYKRVKDYLLEYPGASLSQVSLELEISVERIKSYLRDGRLEILNNEGNLFLECESCGTAIRTGRFCQECSRVLSHDLKNTARAMNESLLKEKQLKKAIEMRYLNKEIKNK